MRRLFHFAAGLTVFMGLLLLGGCAEAPHQPGVLRLAQVAEPTTLDPARAYDTNCIPYVRLLYRGLLDYKPGTAELVDEVAASHEISLDGLTYTFHLRPNVRFHSGRRLTSEDFRFALERVLTPKTMSDGLSMYGNLVGADEWTEDHRGKKTPVLEHIKGIDCPDENTIVFHLKTPDLTFLNLLALPFAYAVPKDYVQELDKQGLSFGENPNGTGPFRFKEWAHDAWVRLERNPDFYRSDVPKCERIELQCSVNPTLGLMLFEQGKLDVFTISDAYPPEFIRITKTPKWTPTIKHASMMDIRYVALNCNLKPFDDVRVRQAVNYAVDHERVASFLSGRAVVAKGVLPKGMPGYDPNLKGYTHDPAKARALLKAANYKPDNPITLWYSTSETFYEKAAQSMQNDLVDIGMPVKLKRLTYADLKKQAGTPKGCEMAILGWLMDYPDPSNFLDVLFNKKQIHENSSLNRCYYDSPKVNKLLDAAAVEVDAKRRLSMYQEVERQVVADAPMLFMVHTERYVVHQPWVTGFQLSPVWAATYENVAVK